MDIIKKKLIFYKTLGYALLILPVLVMILINWTDYFTKSNGVSLSIGAIISLGVVVVCITNKSAVFKGFVGEALILILGWCFNSILSDFLVLYTVFFVCDVIYRLALQKKIKQLEKIYEDRVLAEANKDLTEEQASNFVDKLTEKLDNRNGSV